MTCPSHSLICYVVFLLAGLVLDVHSYAITGISAGVSWDGERPFRTEINDFASSGAAFDLFILSLQALHQLNETELTSYFQVSGIHGYPTVEWDNAPGNPSWGWGYCTHDSVLFPTWHRPYVALFEQVVWETAQSIAATYPSDQVDAYTSAAATFRLPYWDWAANPSMPSVATSPTISVNTPTGYQSIDNPLFTYNFQSQPIGNGFPTSDPTGSPPFTQYMSTLRWPDSNNQSQNSQATQNLEQNSAFLLSTVYQILSANSNYTQISSDAVSQTSIEYVHDAIHYFVGGPNGHMDYLAWAGFDPMFWLHHANVDRIFAIWQALYPDSYVGSWYQSSTYAIPPDTVVDEESNLSPFHYNTADDFYTSTSVRWTKYFGYAYPEVIDWNATNATTLAASVRTKVNQLYNPSAGSSSSSSTSNTSTKLRHRIRSPSVATTSSVLSALTPITPPQYHSLNTPNLPVQWTANLQVSKNALHATNLNISSSFNIDLFLGPPSSTNQSTWPLAPNLLGTFPILSSTTSSSSTTSLPITKHAQIPLTPALALLVQKHLLPSLRPADVKPLLSAMLTARVRFHDQDDQTAGSGSEHNEVGTADLEGFQIEVASRDVTPPKSLSEFPTYGPWMVWPGVTAGL